MELRLVTRTGDTPGKQKGQKEAAVLGGSASPCYSPASRRVVCCAQTVSLRSEIRLGHNTVLRQCLLIAIAVRHAGLKTGSVVYDRFADRDLFFSVPTSARA